MKKAIMALAICAVLASPALARAQTVDYSGMTQDQLRVVLIDLIQQVIGLMNQLKAIQDSQMATSTAPIVNPFVPPVDTGAGVGTEVVVPSTTVETPAAPVVVPTSTPAKPFNNAISVSFATTSDSVAYVTVLNTTDDIAVVKHLIVDSGTLTGFSMDGANFTPCAPSERVIVPMGNQAVLRFEGTPLGVTYQPGSIQGYYTAAEMVF